MSDDDKDGQRISLDPQALARYNDESDNTEDERRSFMDSDEEDGEGDLLLYEELAELLRQQTEQRGSPLPNGLQPTAQNVYDFIKFFERHGLSLAEQLRLVKLHDNLSCYFGLFRGRALSSHETTSQIQTSIAATDMRRIILADKVSRSGSGLALMRGLAVEAAKKDKVISEADTQVTVNVVPGDGFENCQELIDGFSIVMARALHSHPAEHYLKYKLRGLCPPTNSDVPQPYTDTIYGVRVDIVETLEQALHLPESTDCSTR